MGNVRYLTNSSGTTLNSYSYDPYGAQTVSGSTANNFAYQTEQRDAESNLTYLRARAYDPTIGRFTGHDPLSGTIGDLASQNGYNYAYDNPINLSDPSGLNPLSDAFMKYTGLQNYQNAIAKGCDVGSIAAAGAEATLKLAILGGALVAGGEFVAGGASFGIPAVYAAGGATAEAGESGVVTGYTLHALGRLAGSREGTQISPQAVEWIAQNGTKLYNAANDTYKYSTEIGDVVLNRAGKVVTAIAKSKLAQYIR